MGIFQNVTRIGAACVVAIGLAACGQQQRGSDGGAQTVRVDGSSTVFPISEAAAEAFMNENQGQVRVSVGESGTGGGFRRFCRGETEVQGASRPILADEMATCAAANIAYVELPIAFDGITVVVNPSNPVNTVTMAELRRVWEPAADGQVMNWRQVNAAWPDQPLALFGAGTASGTFDFFTESVNGEAKSSRTDYTPSEDDNVTVLGVVNNAGGMGYFGIAYYEQNRERLKALAIDAGQGPIAPNAETVASGAYPLSRPLFIYVNAEALRRPAVARFVRYYAQNAATLAPRVGYVALPESAYAVDLERIEQRSTGTAFGGIQDTSGSIAEVLARPLTETAPAPQQ
ncbi:MAG: PstS family phosphate ABC transporter substrate-binding protein [Hyphomonadaceae bacterium]